MASKRGSKGLGGVVWTDIALFRNLERQPDRALAYLSATTEYFSFRIQAEMRNKAPWKDQTTNARNGLSTVFDISGDGREFTIVMYHRVPYGIWLEIKNSGKYSIIAKQMPTYAKQFADLMARVLAQSLS